MSADDEDIQMDSHLMLEKWNGFATIDSNQINKLAQRKKQEPKRRNLWQFLYDERWRRICIRFFFLNHSSPPSYTHTHTSQRHIVLFITWHFVLNCEIEALKEYELQISSLFLQTHKCLTSNAQAPKCDRKNE